MTTRTRGGARRPRAGTTIIEIMVVITILAVSISIFSGMVVTTARQRSINRESAVAAEGARFVLESMRNESFREVWALYNPDPEDDPGGPGTAPGHRFEIEGLQPVDGSPDGSVGEVFLPSFEAPTLGMGLGGTPPPTVWQLREDKPDAELAMPRDLNGDSIIDGADHSDDFILLPVFIHVQWQGAVGPRKFRMHGMLTDFQKDD